MDVNPDLLGKVLHEVAESLPKQLEELPEKKNEIQKKVDQKNEGTPLTKGEQLANKLWDDLENGWRMSYGITAVGDNQKITYDIPEETVTPTHYTEEIQRKKIQDQAQEIAEKKTYELYRQYYQSINQKLPITLSLRNVKGSWKVRGGSIIAIRIPTFDQKNIFMEVLVESVTHTFISEENHFMDLEISKDYTTTSPFESMKSKKI